MPEPGLFGILQRLGGQPDLDQQIAQGLGRGPGQPGGPPASPLNPPAPGPAGAGGPAAGGPAPGPAAQPTPQAYQSSADMNQLYMQYMRQNQAAQMFNNSLSDMISNFSGIPGGMRSTAAPAGEPAGELFGNLLKLQQYQIGQANLARTQAAVPGILKGYGITDPSQIAYYQSNPDQLHTLAEQHAPEGIYKNWLLGRDDYVKNNSDPSDPQSVAKARNDYEQKVPLISALTPAGGDPDINMLNLEHNQYLSTHGGQEPPDDRYKSIENLKAYKNKFSQLADAQTQAAKGFASANGDLLNMRQNAQGVLDAPDLDTILEKTNPTMLQQARKGGWNASLASTFGMTPDQFETLRKIDQLTSYDTSGIKQANPHLVSNILPIQSDLNGLQDFHIGASNFKKRIGTLMDDVDTARAQAIGAAGQLDRAVGDDNVAGKIDPSYLPGGSNYIGEPKAVTPEMKAFAKQEIAAGRATRETMQLHYKLGGYLPKEEDF